mmetsp:Transcript_40040/g.92918  ORF Transcript_40040/g.92918 Transcript_40040/m.92918 type:complete len:273 (-) Transcript_40040:539-1357(-)
MLASSDLVKLTLTLVAEEESGCTHDVGCCGGPKHKLKAVPLRALQSDTGQPDGEATCKAANGVQDTVDDRSRAARHVLGCGVETHIAQSAQAQRCSEEHLCCALAWRFMHQPQQTSRRPQRPAKLESTAHAHKWSTIRYESICNPPSSVAHCEAGNPWRRCQHGRVTDTQGEGLSEVGRQPRQDQQLPDVVRHGAHNNTPEGAAAQELLPRHATPALRHVRRCVPIDLASIRHTFFVALRCIGGHRKPECGPYETRGSKDEEDAGPAKPSNE